jgi:hypothetical protein
MSTIVGGYFGRTTELSKSRMQVDNSSDDRKKTLIEMEHILDVEELMI